MASLTIRDIPDDILDALRHRARRNHRSLNGEVLSLLERQAFVSVVDAESLIAGVREVQEQYSMAPVDHDEVDAIKRRGRVG